jgi:hypothetical protein
MRECGRSEHDVLGAKQEMMSSNVHGERGGGGGYTILFIN